MKKEKIYKSSFLRVLLVIFGSIKYITFQWLRMDGDGDQIKEAHRIALKTAKEEGVSTYVAEIQNSKGQLTEPTEKWWVGFLKVLKSNGVDDIVTVNPDPKDPSGALKRNANIKWKKSTEANGVKIHNVFKENLYDKIQKINIAKNNKK